jgi:nitrous oxidase accessory protein
VQPVLFEGNAFALNDVALRLHSVEKGARFHGNDFRENDRTIEVDGGGDALGCDVRGNHFSDYEGYDLDGDGVGDVPHRVSALSSELTDAHPELKLFHGTATMHLIDAVAHAVPLLEAHALLEDPAPLVSSPEVPSP